MYISRTPWHLRLLFWWYGTSEAASIAILCWIDCSAPVIFYDGYERRPFFGYADKLYSPVWNPQGGKEVFSGRDIKIRQSKVAADALRMYDEYSQQKPDIQIQHIWGSWSSSDLITVGLVALLIILAMK